MPGLRLSALGHFLYNIEKLRHGDMLKHERRQIVSVFGFELFAARDIPFYLLLSTGAYPAPSFALPWESIIYNSNTGLSSVLE